MAEFRAFDHRYLPIAHATDNGRVAVYLGGCFNTMEPDKARHLRDLIDKSLDELQQREVPHA